MAAVGIDPRACRVGPHHRGPGVLEAGSQGAAPHGPLEEADDLWVGQDLEIFGDEQRRVLRLLRALPSGQRTVAALSYDGLSCEEIAELTGKQAATIRSQLRHARKTLKEVMALDHC
jgi:DNA-directed RNA polymerase specialized sigma24 family protein